MDLRYVVFQTRLSDLPKLAGSFSDPRERVEHGIDLFWRGTELRDDFQAFASRIRRHGSQRSRRRAVRPTYDPLAAHPRSETLAGLHVDFANGTIRLSIRHPGRRTRRNRNAGARVPEPSPSYATLPHAVARSRSRRATQPPAFRSFSCAFRRGPHIATRRKIPSGSLVEIAQAERRAFDSGRARTSRSSVPSSSPTKIISTARAACASAACSAATRDRARRPAHAGAARCRSSRCPAAGARGADRRSQASRRSAITTSRGLQRPAGIGIPLPFPSYEFWLFFAIVCGTFLSAAAPRRPLRSTARELLLLRALERVVRALSVDPDGERFSRSRSRSSDRARARSAIRASCLRSASQRTSPSWAASSTRTSRAAPSQR